MKADRGAQDSFLSRVAQSVLHLEASKPAVSGIEWELSKGHCFINQTKGIWFDLETGQVVFVQRGWIPTVRSKVGASSQDYLRHIFESEPPPYCLETQQTAYCQSIQIQRLQRCYTVDMWSDVPPTCTTTTLGPPYDPCHGRPVLEGTADRLLFAGSVFKRCVTGLPEWVARLDAKNHFQKGWFSMHPAGYCELLDEDHKTYAQALPTWHVLQTYTLTEHCRHVQRTQTDSSKWRFSYSSSAHLQGQLYPYCLRTNLWLERAPADGSLHEIHVPSSFLSGLLPEVQSPIQPPLS